MKHSSIMDAIDNKIFSTSQKGFLPYEGCLEHGFVLKSIPDDARGRFPLRGWI